MSQIPPVRDFIVWPVMAEAKVDILRPDSRKPNAEQEWKLVRLRLDPEISISRRVRPARPGPHPG